MVKKEHMLRMAVRLREAAPDQWEEFVGAVRVYATETAQKLVQATPEGLVLAQGRAQALADMAETLTNAPAALERMTKPPTLRKSNEHGSFWSG